MSCVLCRTLGKENLPDDVGMAEHVVLTVMDSYHKTGQNVPTDNFFTSVKRAKKLLKHNIVAIRTLRSNKKNIKIEPLYDLRKLLNSFL